MNRLDGFIKKLCPFGLEYKKIGDFIDYIQPSQYIVKSTRYDDEYNIPVLTAGKTFILGYTNETNNIFHASMEEPVIIFDDFTGAFQWVDFDFKVKSSAMKILRPKKNISLRYFYHLMSNINYSSSDHARLWIGTYSQFDVPVPSIEIQREVSCLLDDFLALANNLISDLLTEKKLRKNQFDYLKEKLLSGSDFNVEKLEDIAEISTGMSNTIDANEDGHYPFFVRSQEPLKKDTYEFDEEAIITAGDGVGVGRVFHYVNGRYALHQRAYRIKPNNSISGKYLYYYFSFFFPSYILSKMFKGSVPSIRRPMINNFLVKFPDLIIQKKIVHTLEKMDNLFADLSSSISAEITSRQKQYEYYRDKLLTFKELNR